MEPDALMRSRLLKLGSDCTCVALTRYWRSMDRTFADWFIQARHTDRKTAMADTLARFPAKPGPADWNLCLSHPPQAPLDQRGVSEAGSSQVQRDIAGWLGRAFGAAEN